MRKEKKHSSIFEFIARAIMGSEPSADVNDAILRELCGSLGYDAGFIYMGDLDFGETLFLRGSVGSSNLLDFPETIDEDLRASRVVDAPTRSEIARRLNEKLKELFLGRQDPSLRESATILSLPVVENEQLVGIVGVVSLHSSPANTSHEAEASTTAVLTLIARDIRARYNKRQRHFLTHFLECAIDNAGIDIYVVDYHTHEILYINRSMAAPYGTPEGLLGQKCYLALYKDKTKECDFCPKQKLVDDEGNPTKVYAWDYRRPFDGAWFRVFSAAFRDEGDRLALVITSTNITEDKKNEFLVEKMALNDALTDIPNRRAFERDFERVVEAALREDKPGFILFLDLDNFKHINDAFGHEKGDELLCAVASYLDGFSNDRQKAYRYGGDEFIILIEDIEFETVAELVSLLLFRFAESWALDDLEYFCTASIGVAAYPADGVTYDALLNAADRAMYEAKKLGKSTAVYAQRDDQPRSEKMEMEFALRRAVLDGCEEFEVLYHPFVDMKTGRWCGVEALARWNSHAYGDVAPEVFISMCEKLGLISDLEQWLLSAAVGEVSTWRDRLPEDFFLSFNVSAMEFLAEGFKDFVAEKTQEFGYPSERLMLEVIESAPGAHRWSAEIKEGIDLLRSQGILVALDGFGIGNNSLERIQELDIDFIKIDRKFITDFMDDEIRVAVVKAIVMLARAARAKVCAEGVETDEHLACLKSIGCDYVQGRLFCKPKKGAQILSALLAHNAAIDSSDPAISS
ncbi:EAL domain-containing protein [Synergistaceae bacterium OttesenSCG-928-I11]|nr:EAL domain-containing protein [Synergistaceae bacterium OttesenSCG-928-I11]